MGWFGAWERQGDNPDVIYVTVPEYQPSSASVTVGDPFYKASQQNQQVAVRRTGLDTTSFLVIGAVAGVALAMYFAFRGKKKRKRR